MAKSEQDKYYARQNARAKQLEANRRSNEAKARAAEKKEAERRRKQEKNESRSYGL